MSDAARRILLDALLQQEKINAVKAKIELKENKCVETKQANRDDCTAKKFTSDEKMAENLQRRHNNLEEHLKEVTAEHRARYEENQRRSKEREKKYQEQALYFQGVRAESYQKTQDKLAQVETEKAQTLAEKEVVLQKQELERMQEYAAFLEEKERQRVEKSERKQTAVLQALDKHYQVLEAKKREAAYTVQLGEERTEEYNATLKPRRGVDEKLAAEMAQAREQRLANEAAEKERRRQRQLVQEERRQQHQEEQAKKAEEVRVYHEQMEAKRVATKLRADQLHAQRTAAIERNAKKKEQRLNKTKGLMNSYEEMKMAEKKEYARLLAETVERNRLREEKEREELARKIEASDARTKQHQEQQLQAAIVHKHVLTQEAGQREKALGLANKLQKDPSYVLKVSDFKLLGMEPSHPALATHLQKQREREQKKSEKLRTAKTRSGSSSSQKQEEVKSSTRSEEVVKKKRHDRQVRVGRDGKPTNLFMEADSPSASPFSTPLKPHQQMTQEEACLEEEWKSGEEGERLANTIQMPVYSENLDNKSPEDVIVGLKNEHSAYMLALVKKEQENERNRQQMYSHVLTEGDRERLDAIFAAERAKAVDIIRSVAAQQKLQRELVLSQLNLL